MNGFASVIGAVLTTILAMTFGFRVVLFLGLFAYFVALVVLRGLLRPTADGAAREVVDVRTGQAEPAPTFLS